MRTQYRMHPSAIGNLLEDVFGGKDFSKNWTELQGQVKAQPLVNVLKTSTGLRLQALVPGVPKEAISINVKDQVLHLQYSHQDTLAEQVSFQKQEFAIHSFERKFTLPSKVDVSGIVATCANGVLEIQLPFYKEEAPKEFQINIE